MIRDTPCSRRSSSSTRSRNGRVPDFELLSRPTTRPSREAPRLASGTEVPRTTPAGESTSIVVMSRYPPGGSGAFELDVLVRCAPQIVGDEPEPRLRHARTIRVDAGDVPDRQEQHPLVHELLEPMQRRLPPLPIALA